MECLDSFLSWFSDGQHKAYHNKRDSQHLVKKGHRSNNSSRKHAELLDKRGSLPETTVFQSSQQELEAMSSHILHHLQANSVEIHTINRPTELLQKLTGLVDARNITLNNLRHDLQQKEGDLFIHRAELNQRGHDIERLTDETRRLETKIHRDKKRYDETIVNLKATHDDYIKALTQDHLEQRKDLETSYQNQIAVMTASHESFIQTEQRKHSEALEDLSTRTKIRVDKVEQEMRMSIDNFQAKPDRTLVLSFENLKAAVQNLSRFRFDVAMLPPDEEFRARCSEFHLPLHDYKYLLQSYLWGMLVEDIFKSPFRAFGDYGDKLAETWSLLFTQDQSRGTPGSLQSPEPEVVAERWRYATTERLHKALKGKQSFRESDQQIIRSLQDNLANLEHKMVAWLTRMGAQVELSKVQNILNAACDFALTIALERCRIQVYAPSMGKSAKIELEGVVDMNARNDLGMEPKTAQFIVEPGLMKAGNARGGALHKREFLCKAAVYFGS